MLHDAGRLPDSELFGFSETGKPARLRPSTNNLAGDLTEIIQKIYRLNNLSKFNEIASNRLSPCFKLKPVGHSAHNAVVVY